MGKQAIVGASRVNAFSVTPEELIIVGLDDESGPEDPLWQPRLETLPATITEEWVANIKVMGVLEPVTVTKRGEGLFVVKGRRRILGAREANKLLLAEGGTPKRVIVHVWRQDDQMTMAAQIAENANRHNDDAVTLARELQRFIGAGYSEKMAAIAAGIRITDLPRYLALLDLAPPVQKMIQSKQIGQTVALTLKDLPREQQIEKAKEFAAAGVTVEEAQRQTKVRKASNGSEPVEIRKRPSARVIAKLADDKDFLEGLSPDARDLLLWINGEEGRARRVKGLTAKLATLVPDPGLKARRA